MMKNLQYAKMSKQLKNGWQCKKHLRCLFVCVFGVKTVKILETKILKNLNLKKTLVFLDMVIS